MSAAGILQCHRRRFQNSGRSAVVYSVAMLAVTSAQAAPIAWRKDFQAAMRESSSQQKPLLVSVSARWCGPCRKMHSETFPNAALAAQVNNQFIPVLIDADEQPAVVQKLGVEAYPTVLVVSPQQKVVGRFTGFQTPPQLQSQLAAFRPRIVEPKPQYVESTPRPQWLVPLPPRAASGTPQAPYPQPPESEPHVALNVEGPRPHPPDTEPREAAVPFHRRAWVEIQASRQQTTLEAAEEFSSGR